MIVAHLSDCHVRTGPIGAEAMTGLRRALGRLLALRPRPDCIVITGDLTDHGGSAEYELLAELLSSVPVPVHLVSGNHDDPGVMRNMFARDAGQNFPDGFAYTRIHKGANVLILDSHGHSQPAGYLGAEQLH